MCMMFPMLSSKFTKSLELGNNLKQKQQKYPKDYFFYRKKNYFKFKIGLILIDMNQISLKESSKFDICLQLEVMMKNIYRKLPKLLRFRT